MKKNVMMRLACFLLVAVLISTSAISGTYAKYVTEGSSKDTARVAKWGVTVSADYSNLFTKTYETHDAWAGDDGVSVNATVDVVAPGTYGDLADFTVTGTPEVDVAVTYVADLELGELWKVDVTNNDVYNAVEYCPVIFSVNGKTYGMYGTAAENTFGSVAVLEQAVEEAIVASAAKYNAGTNLADANAVADDLAVSWAWPFSTSAENDVKDTALGDAAAADNAATISLEVSCTVTQID